LTAINIIPMFAYDMLEGLDGAVKEEKDKLFLHPA
jgi:hypothetical protein